MSLPSAAELPPTGAWTGAERRRLAAIVGVIILLHVLGVALYLLNQGSVAAAGGLAGAGTLAYVLGMRHAFDADHIAAIDDTTRLMLLRGRRPVGVVSSSPWGTRRSWCFSPLSWRWPPGPSDSPMWTT
jgi:high-affinity nickel-transport protein